MTYFIGLVRFFKEKQKEEFRVAVSSATGEVIGFSHPIEDTASRPLVDKEKERQLLLIFWKPPLPLIPPNILPMPRMSKNLIIVMEYSFSWQKQGCADPLE